MFNPRRNKKGFTLIELIVVIAILAILAAIAIPSISGLIGNAEDKVNLANANTIATAINAYNLTNPVPITDKTKAQTTLQGADLWPDQLAESDVQPALDLITITDDVATVSATTSTPPATS